jgi:hypothetical protein
MDSGTTGERESKKETEEVWKGSQGMPFAERMALKQARDAQIVRWVNRYQVVSAPLLAALLGFGLRTPQNLQTIVRLIERIAGEGHIQVVRQDGIYYAVSFSFSLRKRGAKAQLPHFGLEARRLATFERGMSFTCILLSHELRQKPFAKEKGVLVPDGMTSYGEKVFLWEDETGSHSVAEMATKSTLYADQRKFYQDLFGTTDLKVVWCLDIWKQVPRLMQALQSVPNKDLFLITHHGSTFQPQHASYLRTMTLFYAPKDAIKDPFKETDTHRLLED